MFEIIADIATRLQDEDGKPFFFFYGTKASQNLSKGKGITFPVMYMGAFLPSSGVRAATGFIEEECDIEILFAYKTSTGWTDAQHGEVIRKAKEAAKRFCAYLAQDTRIKSMNKNVGFNEIPHLFDLEISGTILTCKATPLSSTKICTT